MKQFIIIGLGRFGESVARYLYRKKQNVLVIDKDETKIHNIKGMVTHAVQTDATDINNLRNLGVEDFDVAVVSIGGDIHANVLATLNVKELGVPFVVAKAKTELDRKLLAKIGADKIVNPEEDMGRKISYDILYSNIFDYIEFAPNCSLIEIAASSQLEGKTLSELSWDNVEINIIAIKRGGELHLNPGPKEKIKEDDILIIIGEDKDLEKIQQKMID